LLAALIALCIILELRAGSIPLGWVPTEWRYVHKGDDPGRFWLFIVGQSIVMLGAISVGIFQ
jgi:hypothetical protein